MKKGLAMLALWCLCTDMDNWRNLLSGCYLDVLEVRHCVNANLQMDRYYSPMTTALMS